MTARRASRPAARRLAYVVPHTHWDRAWYLPFERYRLKLVRLVDNLLDLVARRPGYRFSLDGQTVVLEDYLEVRPERRAELERAVRSGRVAVGPWYILPDEFLVSSESLVRNLLSGVAMARSFGRVMMAGYVPDPFGHVAQLPQVLNGFGLDSFIFTRGAGDVVGRSGGLFDWRGSDGASRVTAVFQVNGYCSLSAWGVAAPWHRLVDALDELEPDPQAALVRVRRTVAAADKLRWPGRVLLFNNGCDHLPAQPQVPELVAWCNRRLKGLRLVQGTFEDFARALRRQRLRLPSFQGELHEGKHAYLLSGVFSARTYLKQANCRAAAALERAAEPAAALGWLTGARYPRGELLHAWKELLRNQPHDDVCGCSVDAVHRDDEARARHVMEVSAGLAGLAAGRLARRCVDTSVGAELPDAPALLVLNALGRPRSAVIEFRSGPTELPEAAVPRGFSPERGGLVAESGEPVPGRWRRSPDGRLEVRALCPEVPALGWRVLHLARREHRAPDLRADRKRLVIENAHLRVAAAPDGTVTVTDKASGRAWRGLGSFEDREDNGDSYDWSPLERSPRPVTSRGCRAKWRLVEDGPFRAALRGRLTLRVPAEISPDRTRRSRRTVPLRIATTVSLLAGSRRADFEVEFDNPARDHRLRMCFPTGCRARSVRAAGPFDLLERPARFRPRPDYHQPPLPTKHCDGLVTASDRGFGAAVLTEGLHEYEAALQRGRLTLRLTLLRAFGWLSREKLVTRARHAGPALETPEGQALRPHRLWLAFRPHGGAVEEPALLAERDDFLAPAVVAAGVPRAARLPASAGMLELSPAGLCLTAVKRAEGRGSLVARFFNPGRRAARARLSLGFDAAAAWRLRMDETRLRRLPLGSPRAVELRCGPKEVVTVELQPGRGARGAAAK